MELSKRLQAVADLLDPHGCVADIGCDHGFVSIYLVESKKASHCLAMDVNRGPLERAKEHVCQKGLSTYIETRLSNGAKAIGYVQTESGSPVLEVQAALLAGMGGRLMIQIIKDSLDKFLAMEEFVLQPQSEIRGVRQFIREIGCHIVKENMICEDGKYYPMMKVAVGVKSWEAEKNLPPALLRELDEGGMSLWQLEALWDTYGEALLRERNPVLLEFLKKEEILYQEIQKKLSAADTSRSILRQQEMEEKLQEIRWGLEWFENAVL